MACCTSSELRMQKRVSKNIDRQLRLERQRMKRELKLVLLGKGGSGKSTIVRQMRVIVGEGYSDEDRLQFKLPIYRNILIAIQALIEAMERLKIDYESSETRQHAQQLLAVRVEDIDSLEEDMADSISLVWTDGGIQQCYECRRNYQLPDSAKYYLEALNRIRLKDYIPTTQDVLRARLPTIGMKEYVFEIRTLMFRIVDLGRQSLGRKWIHYFEGVRSIIFVVAVSDYDQVLEAEASDRGVNRLQESLSLFATIISRFRHSSVILLLNKKDILKEKIMVSHLADHFPEYTGPKYSYMEAMEFISKLFHSVCPERYGGIYTHFTCATDTGNVQTPAVIFNIVKDHILTQHIMDSMKDERSQGDKHSRS